MKALLYFFVMAVIVIAGCAKDDTMFENNESLKLKKAKVPIPFKGEWFGVADQESGYFSVPLPGGGNIWLVNRGLFASGHGTHIGKIDTEKSFSQITEIEFFLDENGKLYSVQTSYAFMVTANGDSFELISKGKQSWVDGSFVSQDELVPGSATGRLEGATGSFTTVGGWRDGGVWSETEGYIVYE